MNSTLRIEQSREHGARHRVVVTLEVPGRPRRTAESRFEFEISPAEQEAVRWYLEDYLQYPQDPAPKIAEGVESWIDSVGERLFDAALRSGEAGRDLWAELRAGLHDMRVEVVSEVEDATLPWELLRDPRTGVPLALRARSFVRTHPEVVQSVNLPQGGDRIRVLLVICRPRGEDDVPFRSVAAQLLRGLNEAGRELVELEVLRPPTFERLAHTLRQGHRAGRPYHVVHFDGHGMWAEQSKGGEAEQPPGDLVDGFRPEVLAASRKGPRGYLVFEEPGTRSNARLVAGDDLGSLLVECGSPVLVLNSCRSAHMEAPTTPGEHSADAHEKVRAFGSLAQEVMSAGASGVVAMRYNLYVVTAARFVAEMYAALARGHDLGEAVSLGRKHLYDQPLREIAFQPRPLRDWMVPVVYEAAPIRLFPQSTSDAPVVIDFATSVSRSRGLNANLPPGPDAGFYGRDETLLALDRALDTQHVVLLHAWAGSGKTSCITEFARWYIDTGGLCGGAVLFSSFEQHIPLSRLMDRIGDVFAPTLRQAGVQWYALDDSQRREAVLQVLEQLPVLWFWDDVHTVSGFPAGTESAWTDDEQRELVDFLRATRETKARFVLTSRRDEQEWLGELPMRIAMPAMPMQERVLLTRALADRRGKRVDSVEDWRPLLRFTGGNPLAITVLVGQALRDGLQRKEDVEEFVGRLRAGEEAFDDAPEEGRSRSLGAALDYGFEHAFDEGARAQLGVLCMFQGFVDVRVLHTMGHSDASWRLPELDGMNYKQGTGLLNRAADVGLLSALGDGRYRVHPALPWFFRRLVPPAKLPVAMRAFAGASAEASAQLAAIYQKGRREVIGVLQEEEANLLHAFRLSVAHDWWVSAAQVMDGLGVLYRHTGNVAKWTRIVEGLGSAVIEPKTLAPVSGREVVWQTVSYHLSRLMMEAGDYAGSERLLRVMVARSRVAAASSVAKSTLAGGTDRQTHHLATSLHQLAETLRHQSNSECEALYKESYELALRAGDRAGAAITAMHLGDAYCSLSSLEDLSEAEAWFRSSLKSLERHDHMMRAAVQIRLGRVAHERFRDAARAGQSREVLAKLSYAAVVAYHDALALTPPTAAPQIAQTNYQLGTIYADVHDTDRALQHYRESVLHSESSGDWYGAGAARYGAAHALATAERLVDAGEYARAAMRDFKRCGGRAEEMVQQTRDFLEKLEQQLAGKNGDSGSP